MQAVDGAPVEGQGRPHSFLMRQDEGTRDKREERREKTKDGQGFRSVQGDGRLKMSTGA